MDPETENTITLDGRQFAAVNHSLTAAQDDFINGYIGRADALPILRRMNEANCDECAEQLLVNILVRGLKAEILAGCLTEAGKTWNRADAGRNALRFAQITDEAEKAAMQAQIIGFVLSFIQSARPSSKSSPNSSIPSAEADAIASAEPASLETSAS